MFFFFPSKGQAINRQKTVFIHLLCIRKPLSEWIKQQNFYVLERLLIASNALRYVKAN